MRELLSRLLAPFLPEPPEIRPGEDVVFVDVRTPGEYAGGHVAGARLIPHHEMHARWKELRDQRKKRILVYCRTGSRSRVATQVLRSRGFERAENAGGIGGLRRAGVKIERGS
jgi:phage shock protein E